MEKVNANNIAIASSDEHLNNEWIDIQKTTFTNWCNTTLSCHNLTIKDLYKDFCDGIILIKLYESVSGKRILKTIQNPKVISQRLENISLVMKAMSLDGVKFVNIDPFDICDGNPKLILALVWHVILYYQIGFSNSQMESCASESSRLPNNTQKSENKPMENTKPKDCTRSTHSISIKGLILKLINELIPQHVVTNLTSEWNNGKLLAALVDTLSPGSCSSYQTWNQKNSLLNATTALCLAEVHLGIPVLIEPHHMVAKNMDERSMITYLSSFTKDGGVAEKFMVNQLTEKFPILVSMITNMTTDWSTGEALCELVKACDLNALSKGYYKNLSAEVGTEAYNKKCLSNIEYAMSEAQTFLGIASCIDPQTLVLKNVPALAVMSYLSSFLHIKPKQEFNTEKIGSPSCFSVKWVSANEDFYVGNEVKLLISSDKFDIPSDSHSSVDVSYKISDKIHKVSHLKKTWNSTKECCVEFKPLEISEYRVDVKIDGVSIAGSPLLTKVLYPVLQASDVSIEDLNRDVVNVGDSLMFIVHSNHPIDLLNCVLQDTLTKRRITCETIKMSDKLFKVNAKFDAKGKYNILLQPNNAREIIKKTIECIECFKDRIKVLCSQVIHAVQGERINFKVDSTDAGYGQLDVKITSENKGSDVINGVAELVEKNGVWDVRVCIPENRCYKWIAHLYWNKSLIPDKCVAIHIFNPDKVKVSGCGLNSSVQILSRHSFQIYAGECGMLSEITGFLQKKDDSGELSTIKLKFDLLDGSLYETSYRLNSVGSYNIKVYMNGELVKLATKQIEGMNLSELKYEFSSNSGVIGEKVDVKIIIPISAGKGDLFYAMEGPDGPMKVYVEPLFRDEYEEVYLLSSVPNKPGEYKLILHFGGLAIPGFPKSFTISERNTIDVKKIKLETQHLKAAVVDIENMFEIEILEHAGKAELHGYYTYIESSKNARHVINFCQTEVVTHMKKYRGDFKVHKQEDIVLRIFYGENELEQSPIKIPVIDLSMIETHSHDDLSNQVIVNQRYIFDIFIPIQNIYPCLKASIVPPKGHIVFPEITKFTGDPDHFKQWLGREGCIYQIEFTPTEEGKYVINFSFLHHSISGFPKVFYSKKAKPSIPEENKISVDFPKNCEFELGQMASLLVDATNAAPGGILKVFIVDPDRISIPLEIVPVYCKNDSKSYNESPVVSIFRVNFNLEKSGIFNATITWNGKILPCCPIILKAISTFPETSLRNGVIADGFVGEKITVVLDNVFERINELTCMCYDASRKLITTVLEPHPKQVGSYHLCILPIFPGMHQVEIIHEGRHIKGSPFYFKVVYPINPRNIKVYGPGVVSGVIDDEKGIIYIKTDTAGSGLMQVAIQGPKNGFKLKTVGKEHDDYEELPSNFNLDYHPKLSGLYVVNVLWSGEHVPGSPFQVYNCNNQRDLRDIIDGRIPPNYLANNTTKFQNSYKC